MYTQVAYALAVASATEAVSQAVSVSGANAVGVDLTVINYAGSTLTVTLEGSNDLANWKELDGTWSLPASAVGYAQDQYPDPAGATNTNQRIGYEYVRLRYSQAGTSVTSIVSAGINVFEA